METLRSWPWPAAFAVLFVVVLLRAGGTYALGRAARAGVARTRVQRRLESPGFARAQDLVARWGVPLVVVSFLTVGFQTLVNLAAGVARMPLRRYLPALVLGGALWALLYATVGLVTVEGLRRLYAVSPVAAVLAGLALVAAGVAYGVVQVRRGHREADRADELA